MIGSRSCWLTSGFKVKLLLLNSSLGKRQEVVAVAPLFFWTSLGVEESSKAKPRLAPQTSKEQLPFCSVPGSQELNRGEQCSKAPCPLLQPGTLVWGASRRLFPTTWVPSRRGQEQQGNASCPFSQLGSPWSGKVWGSWYCCFTPLPNQTGRGSYRHLRL